MKKTAASKAKWFDKHVMVIGPDKDSEKKALAFLKKKHVGNLDFPQEFSANATCRCGSGFEPFWINDARGIPLAKVCDKCEAEKLKKFRPDVMEDSGYWHDEPIDED